MPEEIRTVRQMAARSPLGAAVFGDPAERTKSTDGVLPANGYRALDKEPSRCQGSQAGGLSVTVHAVEDRADMKAMVALGARAHAESVFRHLPYDSEGLARSIEKAFRKPKRYSILLCRRHGIAIGFLVGVVDRHYFSSALGATLQTVFVVPEHRGSAAAYRLLRAFGSWAKTCGALALYVNVTSGVLIGPTDRMLRRRGFVQVGGNYALSLS